MYLQNILPILYGLIVTNDRLENCGSISSPSYLFEVKTIVLTCSDNVVLYRVVVQLPTDNYKRKILCIFISILANLPVKNLHCIILRRDDSVNQLRKTNKSPRTILLTKTIFGQ